MTPVLATRSGGMVTLLVSKPSARQPDGTREVLDHALQEARHQWPREIRVVRLKPRVVGVAEPMVGVGEEMPLYEVAVRGKTLPQRRLDGGRRDVVEAAREDQRRAGQRPREVERMP